MATAVIPSTPNSRLNRTTELLLVSPEMQSASRPSTGRKRKITPTQEESSPQKMAVLTWPEPKASPLSSLISDALIHHWPAAAVQAFIDSGRPYGPYQPNPLYSGPTPPMVQQLPYGPHQPNPLYSGPAPLTVRHIVLSFDLGDTPDKLYDDDNLAFIFNLFPGTVALAMSEPFLLFGMRNLPPKPWPKTVAGLVPYFYVEHGERGMGPTAAAHLPTPIGISARPTNRTIAAELDGRDTQDWTAIFQAVREDFEQQEIAITEVMYWWTYITIVLERRDVDPSKLPRRVGKLACGYLFEDEMGRSAPLHARRLTDPTPERPDESIYTTLQPGLRIGSGYIPGQEQQYMTTTTGVLVKDRIGNRYMTAAAHGFPAECGTNVYHPNPQSRVIGELIMELDQTDIALVKLKGCEEFRNVTFENADMPTSVQLGRLLPSTSLRKRDLVWMDSPNTGFIEGTHITTAYERIPADDKLERPRYWIETTWVWMGQDADGILPEGVCGSAIFTGKDGSPNVVGIFRYAPQGGPMSGYCNGISANELTNRGYTLAD